VIGLPGCEQVERDAPPLDTPSSPATGGVHTAQSQRHDDHPRDDNPYATLTPSAFLAPPADHQGLLQRILDDPRMQHHAAGLLSCLQCGICTSGCPAARFGDFSPREISRRALLGDPTLLTDDSVWLCCYCYTCQSRCPRGNSVAVINQIIRGMQVESGYGLKHVALFVAWTEQFYSTGLGGWPRQLLYAIADAWGDRWWHLVEHLDEMRDDLGVGSLYPSEQAMDELRAIMDQTGSRERLQGPATRTGRPPLGALTDPPGILPRRGRERDGVGFQAAANERTT
jgi:heterodisulfide reductase subunit C